MYQTNVEDILSIGKKNIRKQQICVQTHTQAHE